MNRAAAAYGWEDAHTFMRENDRDTWTDTLTGSPSEALINALTVNKTADLFQVDPEAPEFCDALADYDAEWRRAIKTTLAKDVTP